MTTTNDAARARANLAAYFRSKAAWRRDVARERCREGTWAELKNLRYAEQMDAVAAHVESLADDHPILRKAIGLQFGNLDGLHTGDIHCDLRRADLTRSLESWVESAVKEDRRVRRRLKKFESR
jgi:hypothetical protein